ncbi:DUF2924 domain-containing protein [Parasphingorhabdus sp. JC815]|uniref:DUF2924 domain-containing protein n=1 Tax=Parasphingorhabdus sp. JC815 TaxID=3232140 RepID=UPI0034594A21
MSALNTRLEELAAMPPAQLRSIWRDTFRRPAPEIPPNLLRRSIAWRLQERVHGGLTPSVKKRIAQVQKQFTKTNVAGTLPDIALKPGTRLVRTWKGESYHVFVGEDGFEYHGRQYRSLSPIAEEITGAHWSGPRFFGLKKRSGFKPKASIDD